MKRKYFVGVVLEIEDIHVREVDKWRWAANWTRCFRESLSQPKAMQLHEVQVYPIGDNNEIAEKPTLNLANLFDGWPE